MKNLLFGIEVGTAGQYRHMLARAVQRVVGGSLALGDQGFTITDRFGRTWRVVQHHSLSDGQKGGKLVSPILGYDELEEVQHVIRAVRGAGAKSNPFTAVHVHVDANPFGATSWTNLVKLADKQERRSAQALAILEARFAQNGHSIGLDFTEYLKSHRGQAIPVVRDVPFSKGAIEFRYSYDTLDADQVKAYVQHALAMADAALGVEN